MRMLPNRINIGLATLESGDFTTAALVQISPVEGEEESDLGPWMVDIYDVALNECVTLGDTTQARELAELLLKAVEKIEAMQR